MAKNQKVQQLSPAQQMLADERARRQIRPTVEVSEGHDPWNLGLADATKSVCVIGDQAGVRLGNIQNVNRKGDVYNYHALMTVTEVARLIVDLELVMERSTASFARKQEAQ